MTRKLTTFLIVLGSAFLASCTSQETVAELADRVFSLAEKQYLDMDGMLSDGTFPRSVDMEGKLVTSDVQWWCSGFFPGSLWMLYERSGNGEILAAAEKNTLKLSGLLEHHTDHDVGFQINNSYGQALRITGDEAWKPMIKASADRLATRFNPVAGTIRSWDFTPKGRDWQWPVIIDNMMNLELLMSAASLFGDDSLREIALTHARTTARNHFREDYSSFHLVDYDIADGHARGRQTVQGLADDSAWARGQAWALYGYVMMASMSGDGDFLKLAENIARFIMDRLPEDGIPYWDFDSEKIPDDYRDASAGAIMASAFAELSLLTADAELAGQAIAMSEKQVRALASDGYLAEEGSNCGFLLKHCVGNLPSGSEVDAPLTYADYYFLEAICRLEKALTCLPK